MSHSTAAQSSLNRHHNRVANRSQPVTMVATERLVPPLVDTASVSVPNAGSLLFDPYQTAMFISDGTTLQQVNTTTSSSTLSFITTTIDPMLTDARRIVDSATITVSDGGAGGTLQFNDVRVSDNSVSDITLTNETTALPNSRRLINSGSVTVTDNGPGSTVQLTANASASNISSLTVADEHAVDAQARQLVGSDTVSLVDNGAGNTLEVHVIGGSPNTTSVTLTDESLSLPSSRRLVNSATVTLTDGGAGGTLQFNAIGGSLTTTSVLTAIDNSGTLANSRRIVNSPTVTVTDGGASGTLSFTAVPTSSAAVADSVEHIPVAQFTQANPDVTKTHTYISITTNIQAGACAFGTLNDALSDGVRKTVKLESVVDPSSGGYMLTIAHHLSRYGEGLVAPFTYQLDAPGQSISLIWNNTRGAWQEQNNNHSIGPAAVVVVGCNDDVPETLSLGTASELAGSTTVTLPPGSTLDSRAINGLLEWDVQTYDPTGSTISVTGFVATRNSGNPWVPSMVGGTLIINGGTKHTIVAFTSNSSLLLDATVSASSAPYTITYQPLAVYSTGTVTGGASASAIVTPKAGSGAVFSSDFIGSQIYIQKRVGGVLTTVYTRTIWAYNSVSGALTLSDTVTLGSNLAQSFTIPYRQTITAVPDGQTLTVNAPLHASGTGNMSTTAVLRYLRIVTATAANGQCVAQGFNIEHMGKSTFTDVVTAGAGNLTGKGGGTMRIRKGRYTVTNTPTNDDFQIGSASAPIVICGEGWGTKLVRGEFKKNTIRMVSASDVTIADMEFTYSPWVNTFTYANDPGIADSGAAVYFNGATQCTVRNCHFERIFGAIGSSVGETRILIDSCVVERCRGGIQFNKCQFVNTVNCSFRAMHDDNLNYSSNSSNCLVYNCDWDNAAGAGGHCIIIDAGDITGGDPTSTFCRYITVNGCRFNNNDYPAVYFGNNVFNCTVDGNSFVNCGGGASQSQLDLQAPIPGDGAVSICYPYAHDNAFTNNTFQGCTRAITCQARGNIFRNNTFAECSKSCLIVDGNSVSNSTEVIQDRNTFGDVTNRTTLTSCQTSNTSSTPAVVQSTFFGGSPAWRLLYGTANVEAVVDFRLQASDTLPMAYGGRITSVALGMALDPTGFNTGTGPVTVKLWQLTAAGNALALLATMSGVSVPEDTGSLLTDPSVVVPIPAGVVVPVAAIQYRITVVPDTTGRRLRFRVSNGGTTYGRTSQISSIGTDNLDYSVSAVARGPPTAYVDIGQFGNCVGQLRLGGSQGTPISRLVLYHLSGNTTFGSIPAHGEATVTAAATTAGYTGQGFVTVSPGGSNSTVTLIGGPAFDGSLIGGTITVGGNFPQTIANVTSAARLTTVGVLNVATPTTYTLQPLGGARTTDLIFLTGSSTAVPTGLVLCNPYVSSTNNITFKIANVTSSTYSSGIVFDVWAYGISL
jgi:hypothetical protein